ncbi:phosphoribosylformylglycinamidine cyclo-ligase [Blattabacterium cuenoti]|uniref:phosphoribosylformylglycinamidine cyclo-ligase n=1 Tax=Blattabacterium cuenoti TaxID=1653831 RepID=UPI00163B8715|nr:phosphoribosylformylglycinamidine cyclo-ligase [Blattabacterium cuenoti]
MKVKNNITYKINKILKKTYTKKVLSNLDHFSGFYKIYNKYKNPILVSGTDGVGTKICLSINFKKYDLIGIDCFAMCINDILCHGAEPMFFLDYLACNKINSFIIENIIKGIACSCKENNTCFIGGETAEMPGFYPKNGYDIAGFCVGIVDQDNLIDGKKLIKENDVIIGFESSGIHSNGFSVIRNIFSENDLKKGFFDKKPFYEILLIPTKIYYNLISYLLKKISIHGIAHITGGGILDNLSRIIPENLSAVIDKKKIPIKSIFNFIQKKGNLSEELMWKTFNMGLGMIIIISSKEKDFLLKKIKIKEKPYVIGSIVKRKNKEINLI